MTDLKWNTPRLAPREEALVSWDRRPLPRWVRTREETVVLRDPRWEVEVEQKRHGLALHCLYDGDEKIAVFPDRKPDLQRRAEFSQPDHLKTPPEALLPGEGEVSWDGKFFDEDYEQVLESRTSALGSTYYVLTRDQHEVVKANVKGETFEMSAGDFVKVEKGLYLFRDTDGAVYVFDYRQVKEMRKMGYLAQ